MSTLSIDTPRWALPLLQQARHKCAFGGRASGKSHFFAEKIIEDCIVEKIDAVCVREIQNSIRLSVKKLIEAKIEKMGVGSLFEVQDQIIKCPHGGIIAFTGMQNHTAESIKSLEGFKRCWVEEAQAISQRSIDLLIPTIMRTDGAEMWWSWNPDLPSDPVDKLFRSDHKPLQSVIVETNYRDNPWLLPELLLDIEQDRARDPDKYAHIWLGEYRRNSEARVFRNWKVEEFDAPEGVTFRYGADFGFSIDPSCAVRCYIVGRNLYIDHEAYRIGCEIDQLPDLFMSIPDIERWPMVADTSRPDTISYLRRHGFPKIQAAVKGIRSIEEGIAFLQSFDIIVHPRCQHVIDELTMYSYKVDPLTSLVLPVLEDKNNHMIDSLRYGCEGVRRALATRRSEAPPGTVKRYVDGGRSGSASWMGS